MVRPALPVLRWLLWLAIALLPLRGWAMAQMAVAELAPVLAQSGVHHACHEAAASPQPAPATDRQVDTALHAGCTLCEVCHAGLAPAATSALALPELPHAPPATAPPTGPPDVPATALFRPPRG
ncbi:MAG: hypothetical protein QG612_2560 [Pseudomonadota bacterium]|nr:hypothetical protein [Pseudomonadota bacterium]